MTRDAVLGTDYQAPQRMLSQETENFEFMILFSDGKLQFKPEAKSYFQPIVETLASRYQTINIAATMLFFLVLLRLVLVYESVRLER